jgi:hypothetical protein
LVATSLTFETTGFSIVSAKSGAASLPAVDAWRFAVPLFAGVAASILPVLPDWTGTPGTFAATAAFFVAASFTALVPAPLSGARVLFTVLWAGLAMDFDLAAEALPRLAVALASDVAVAGAAALLLAVLAALPLAADLVTVAFMSSPH